MSEERVWKGNERERRKLYNKRFVDKMKRLGICRDACGRPVKAGRVFCPDCLLKKLWKRIEREYGVTHEQWMKMYSDQGGRCASCGDAGGVPGGETPLCVDHSHATGRVRGLLCNPCNKLLGFAREDRQRLEMASNYLLKFEHV